MSSLSEVKKSHRDRMLALLYDTNSGVGSRDVPVRVYNQNVERAFDYGIEAAEALRQVPLDEAIRYGEAVATKPWMERHGAHVVAVQRENDLFTRKQFEPILAAAELVLKTFEQDEASGFHTRDRQFAIDILRNGLR